jgi:surface antigen
MDKEIARKTIFRQSVLRIAASVVFLLTSAVSVGQGAHSFEYRPPQLFGAPYVSPTNSFERGQCTWYVFGRVIERSGISLQFTQQSSRDAELWEQLLSPEYRRTRTPEAGAIGVWKHKTIADFGHVAYVEGVYGNVVLYTEANFSVPGSYDGTIKASTITDFEINKGGKPWEFLGYVVPTSSTTVSGLDGAYYNTEFQFGFRIQGREGIATVSNSPRYSVGDVMLKLTETDPTEFVGEQLCVDGAFHPVTGVLTPQGNLDMTIQGCWPSQYTMVRQ